MSRTTGVETNSIIYNDNISINFTLFKMSMCENDRTKFVGYWTKTIKPKMNTNCLFPKTHGTPRGRNYSDSRTFRY